MERTLKLIAASLPLVFALAFLVPVLDQGMQALGITSFFGFATLSAALAIGGTWGLFAMITGRWI